FWHGNVDIFIVSIFHLCFVCFFSCILHLDAIVSVVCVHHSRLRRVVHHLSIVRSIIIQFHTKRAIMVISCTHHGLIRVGGLVFHRIEINLEIISIPWKGGSHFHRVFSSRNLHSRKM